MLVGTVGTSSDAESFDSSSSHDFDNSSLTIPTIPILMIPTVPVLMIPTVLRNSDNDDKSSDSESCDNLDSESLTNNSESVYESDKTSSSQTMPRRSLREWAINQETSHDAHLLQYCVPIQFN